MLLKKLFTYLCAAAMGLSLLTLSGCHGSKKLAGFDVPEGFDASRSYEITFWAKNDTNITQTRVYEKAITDFMELYPNITVKLKLYTDYGRIYNDVITNIATGTTPNVCITYPDHIATYLTGGDNTVVPLDDLMADRKYGLGGSELKFDSPAVDEVIPNFLNECRLNGSQYALPFLRSSEVLYINKTAVESMGYTLPDEITWDFIWEVADAAAEKNPDGTYKVNGQKVMIPFIYKSTDNMMIQLLKQKNAGYSTPSGAIQIFNDDTKSLLYTIAKHTKTGAFSTFKISSYPGNFLNCGQCIFAIDSTAGATWIGSDAPLSDVAKESLVEFETEVRIIPQFDPDNPSMISQGPSICIFNKEDPQEVLASWMFGQFLLTNDIQIGYAKTEGYVPVTSKAQNDEEYQDYLSRCGEDNNEHYHVKIEAAKLLLENTENTFITPVFNGSASLRSAAGQLIENVVKSVMRKETVDEEYMQKLYDDVSSLYRLDQINMNKGKADLGELPVMSVVLLGALALGWTLILAYVIIGRVRAKRRRNR